MNKKSNSKVVSLISGGAAGTAVDIILFPLDTIKTRLQSRNGFIKSGGFKGIYKGLSSAIIGSAPNASAFFLTYDSVKSLKLVNNDLINQLLAANAGEINACLIRVPIEVVKQRSQANLNKTTYEVFRETLKQEGIKGFYRGYLTTLLREIPFSSIQFPLWELLKLKLKQFNNKDCEPWQSALCGALSGAISAALTTPLDVAKTRIILSERDKLHKQLRIINTLKEIYKENGLKGLFSGVYPRVIMISFGGFIFFGVYEKTKNILLEVY
jgi:solute carrier family 25 (mitochondrial S-adenosylmethionine transporter), member 26